MDELLREFQDLLMKFSNLYGRMAQKIYTPKPAIRVVLDRVNGIVPIPNLDNLIKTKENTDFKAAKPIKEEKMPPKYEDGTFREKGNGWEYRFMYFDEATGKNKQISKCAPSKQECFNIRTALIAGTNTKKKEKQILILSDWFNKWYDTYKKPYNGVSSLNMIKTYMHKHILPSLGKKPLNRVTGLDLQDFINQFADKPNTQSKIGGVLNGALEKARKLQLIKVNPFEMVELTPHRRESFRALEFSEQQLIYNAIDEPKYRRLFMFCCCTGIRIGRVLELRTEDFDFRRMEITVVKKQKKGLREVYKVPFLANLIDLPATGKIFTEFQYSGARIYFDKLFRKLNIEKVNIHSFRHTFISMCYHIGIKDKQIQAWAGHSTLEMTMDTYTHLLKTSANSPILSYLQELKRETGV